jgi:hypothetical protein
MFLTALDRSTRLMAAREEGGVVTGGKETERKGGAELGEWDLFIALLIHCRGCLGQYPDQMPGRGGSWRNGSSSLRDED